jgi:hypothetical protein
VLGRVMGMESERKGNGLWSWNSLAQNMACCSHMHSLLNLYKPNIRGDVIFACLSTCFNSKSAGWIVMEFDIGLQRFVGLF